MISGLGHHNKSQAPGLSAQSKEIMARSTPAHARTLQSIVSRPTGGGSLKRHLNQPASYPSVGETGGMRANSELGDSHQVEIPRINIYSYSP
jgi:hypothetical protein